MSAGSKSNDELAHTATIVGSPAASERAARTSGSSLGGTLGRYRLERELGSGGMGVVYCAFDPDLERRIALKVLRTADSPDGRKRLLREARAMARLFHANVVTVYEVGNTEGRDFVAMELVDGGSLADWLRDGVRLPNEILDVFAFAGRGLGAAHAAGIVHRDFKPHNVLCGRDGRILVTDFGLARDASLALETTLQSVPGDTRSADVTLGLTATGSVLGTPAYMAPEQWSGGRVGPAADQFAFCIALWEALAGERPYKGTTSEQLRDLVTRGPSKLDDTRLPRHIRGPLRRGLDPDPNKRWPSMGALIDAMQPKRRRGVWFALAGAGVIAMGGVIAVLALAGKSNEAQQPCPTPRLPTAVWSSEARSAMQGAGRAAIVPLFDSDTIDWYSARDATCKADTGRNTACLEGVIARMETAVKAAGKTTGELPADLVAAQLVDPHTCEPLEAPALGLTATDDAVAAMAESFALAKNPNGPTVELDRLAHGRDACARGLARVALHDATVDTGTRKRLARELADDAAACGDDRLRAESDLMLLADASKGPERGRAYAMATASVQRVVQPDLQARLAVEEAKGARDTGQWPDAFAALDRAATLFAGRGHTRAELRVRALAATYHLERGQRDDLDAIHAIARAHTAAAKAAGMTGVVNDLARADAAALLYIGTPEAHEALNAAWAPDPWQSGRGEIRGKVVDAAGRPVVGAIVYASPHLRADKAGAVAMDGSLRKAQTDDNGEYLMPEAPTTGAVVAIANGQRSLPVAVKGKVDLTLQPTRTIQGRVAGAIPATTLAAATVRATGDTYIVIAPIGLDGTFTLAGLPQGAVTVGTLRHAHDVVEHEVYVGAATAMVTLSVVTRDRVLNVEVLGPLAGVDPRVLLIPGVQDAAAIVSGAPMREDTRMAVATPADSPIDLKVEGAQLAISLKGVDHRIAQFDSVSAGELTACLVPIEDRDEPIGKILARLQKAGKLICATVPTGAESVRLDVRQNR